MLQPPSWVQSKPQRHKPSRINFTSKKLIPIYLTLVISWFVFSRLTQPHFQPISEICQDYQLQKTLYASTPVNSECDRAIAESEASYLVTYPVVTSQLSTSGYLALIALAGGVLVTLRTRSILRQILQSASRLRFRNS